MKKILIILTITITIITIALIIISNNSMNEYSLMDEINNSNEKYILIEEISNMNEFKYIEFIKSEPISIVDEISDKLVPNELIDQYQFTGFTDSSITNTYNNSEKDTFSNVVDNLFDRYNLNKSLYKDYVKPLIPDQEVSNENISLYLYSFFGKENLDITLSVIMLEKDNNFVVLTDGSVINTYEQKEYNMDFNINNYNFIDTNLENNRINICKFNSYYNEKLQYNLTTLIVPIFSFDCNNDTKNYIDIIFPIDAINSEIYNEIDDQQSEMEIENIIFIEKADEYYTLLDEIY